MALTQAQYERMKRYRHQLLETPNGRAVLTDMLTGMGLFKGKRAIRERLEVDPAFVRSLLNAIGVLEELGVWTEENFPRLVDKMATLPIPDLERHDHGET